MQKLPFFFIAVAGFSLAAIVHFCALAGINLNLYFPVFLLHILVFVVFIPAILIFNQNPKIKELKKQRSREANKAIRKEMFRNAPRALKILVGACFVYAIINFMLFMSSQAGTPEEKDGTYYLQNKGTFIRNITKKEYDFHLTNEVRGFSGHWLLFFGASMMMLYPFKKEEEETEDIA